VNEVRSLFILGAYMWSKETLPVALFRMSVKNKGMDTTGLQLSDWYWYRQSCKLPQSCTWQLPIRSVTCTERGQEVRFYSKNE